MSELTRNLIHLLKNREKLSTDGLSELASKIMRAEGEGLGWEYGPDFERQDVDAFAIAIGWNLDQKRHLDRIHSLPCEGEGWRIVSGLLPRDADQVVHWGNKEYDASHWKFLLKPEQGTIVVYAPGVPKTPRLEIVENLIVAEAGEVNAARFLGKVETTDSATDKALKFSMFARTFAEAFPGCEYRDLLRSKSAGRTQRTNKGT